jgi:hypothetical protein
MVNLVVEFVYYKSHSFIVDKLSIPGFCCGHSRNFDDRKVNLG